MEMNNWLVNGDGEWQRLGHLKKYCIRTTSEKNIQCNGRKTRPVLSFQSTW
jgi:hypothetical protein